MSEALPSKRCFKCGEVKILSDFYKHPQMSDGHLNKCKECNKLDVRQNTEKRSEYYKAYDRVRTALPHRKAAKSEYGKRPEVRERKKITVKNSPNVEQNKYRMAATTQVNNAVRDGILTKLPCWVCGCTEVQGHHPDYDSPLDVIWLCTTHHAEIHREYDRELDELTLLTTEKGSRWKTA